MTGQTGYIHRRGVNLYYHFRFIVVAKCVAILVFVVITYLPRKAVAEVSNHSEPIGRKFGIQLVRKSIDFRFNCFELQLI